MSPVELIVRRLAPRERVALTIAGQYSGRSIADVAAMAGTGSDAVRSALRKTQWLGLCLLPARQIGGAPIVLTTNDLVDAVNAINAALLQLTTQATEDFVTAAVEELWDKIDSGDLRVTAEGGRLHVDPFNGTKPERRMVRMLNNPFVEARRRVLYAAALPQALPVPISGAELP
jgi:hypothetical protein